MGFTSKAQNKWCVQGIQLVASGNKESAVEKFHKSLSKGKGDLINSVWCNYYLGHLAEETNWGQVKMYYQKLVDSLQSVIIIEDSIPSSQGIAHAYYVLDQKNSAFWSYGEAIGGGQELTDKEKWEFTLSAYETGYYSDAQKIANTIKKPGLLQPKFTIVMAVCELQLTSSIIEQMQIGDTVKLNQTMNLCLGSRQDQILLFRNRAGYFSAVWNVIGDSTEFKPVSEEQLRQLVKAELKLRSCTTDFSQKPMHGTVVYSIIFGKNEYRFTHHSGVHHCPLDWKEVLE